MNDQRADGYVNTINPLRFIDPLALFPYKLLSSSSSAGLCPKTYPSAALTTDLNCQENVDAFGCAAKTTKNAGACGKPRARIMERIWSIISAIRGNTPNRRKFLAVSSRQNDRQTSQLCCVHSRGKQQTTGETRTTTETSIAVLWLDPPAILGVCC